MHFKKIFSILICMALLLSTMTYAVTVSDTSAVKTEAVVQPTVKAAEGSGVCGGDLRWEISWTNESTLTISGTGPMDDYSMPSKTPWYASRNAVTKIVIENGVTSIGDYAFYGFSNLKTIKIAKSVTSLGSYSISNCDSLTSVALPSNVESIGREAFSSCEAMESITVDSGNKSFSSDINGVLFNNDKTELIYYPTGAYRTSYTVPDSVKVISDYAFSDLKYLSELNVGTGVEYLDIYSFSENISLERINVDSENIIFSSADGVLFNKDKTVLIKYPPKNKNTSYTIPSSVKYIEDMAFIGCDAIEKLVIPNGVESIGFYAFESCSALCDVSMSDTVKNIGYNAFMGTPYTEDLSYAVNCGAYYEIYVGNVLLYIIDANVASDSYRVTLRENTSAIAYGAFEYSYASEVVIPESVKYIGNGAFSYCSTLLNVTIPYTVKGIGYNVFEFCMNLTNVTIGSDVEFIGENAFLECESLVEINVDSDNRKYKNDEYGVLFTRDGDVLVQYPIGNERTEYTVPDGVEMIASGAFESASNIGKLTLPESLTTVGDYAFDCCYDLTEVYYCGNEIMWNDIVFGDYNDSLLGANVTFAKNAPEISEIILASNPDKYDYVFGEELSLDGISVYAIYTDGSKMEILNYSISGFDPYKLGKQTITVFYSDFSTEFTVCVSISEMANGFTARIEAGKTVGEFKASYSEYDVYVYGFDGEELYDNELIKTDYTVVVINGNTIEENCYIIVDGDGNCDGVVNGKDLIRLKKHIIGGNAAVCDEYVDYNGDGVLNDSDAEYLTAMI